MNTYMVSYAEDGGIDKVQKVDTDEVPRKKQLNIKAESHSDAVKAAKLLYSLAK